jgi:Na+-transporting methylmalonyl-CoA/oxaloacetate decarboxylase gamma subunit
MAIDWGFALRIAGFGILLVFAILVLLVVITWVLTRFAAPKGPEGKDKEEGKGANQG